MKDATGGTINNQTKIYYDIKKFKESSSVSFWHDIKRQILKNKSYKLLYSLLKDNYAFMLSSTINSIEEIQYKLIANTGWSVSESGCCFLESHYEVYEDGTRKWKNVSYSLLRGENGYCVNPESNGYVGSVENAFYDKNKEALDQIHELFNLRDDLIENIYTGLKNHNNEYIIDELVDFLGLDPEDRIHNSNMNILDETNNVSNTEYVRKRF